jgi:3-hydroxyacyl-[acyl-carrier-protein] dehydratase
MSDLPAEKTVMDIQQIMSILPHRYPFLLIDRVIEMERKKRIVSIKNVTANEPQFTGHFPGLPLMPGVLTIEAMAQTGGVLLLSEFEDRDERLMVFTGIEAARFRKPIVPGDQMRIEVDVISWRPKISKMHGVCTVDGVVAAEATLTCALLPRKREGAPEEASSTQAPQ